MTPDQNPATAQQPLPSGTGPDIATLVKADVEARAQLGQERYGERLKAGNGRNQLADAYQEALDQAMYLRAALEHQARDKARIEQLEAKNAAYQSAFSEGNLWRITKQWLEAADRADGAEAELQRVKSSCGNG